MNPSLNSYRFFAFLAVFLFHIGYLPSGYLGVQAFFVLSGFLITPILIKTKENSSNISLYLKNFLTRRFLRIFPLYYAYLFGILLIILFFDLDSKSTYFASLLKQLPYGFMYVYNFYHQTVYFEYNVFITHFWSLALEEQFYIFWPFLIYYTSIKSLKRILIYICICIPFIRFLTGYVTDNNVFTFLIPDKYLIVYLSTFSHIDAFAIGGLFGILPNINFKNHYIFALFFLTVFLGLGINLFIEENLNILSLGYGYFMRGAYKYIWGYTLWNLLFALVLIGLRNRTFLPKIFENKMLASLGLISYGLYVYHFGMIWIVKYLRNKELMFESIALGNLVTFFFTTIVSYISFLYFEKIFINLKDKLAPKHL